MPLALLFAGCADLGERASTGMCPVGQVCSDETPVGLQFTGTDLGDLLLDGGVHATAVGGTQDIAVFDYRDGSALDVPFAAAFEDASGRPVTSQRVDGVVQNRIAIAAEDAGAPLLALRDVQGALLDRLAIVAHPVDRISLRPADGDLLEDRSAPFVAWAGAPLSLTVALESAGGVRLVDTSLTIGGSGVTRQRWDTFEVVAADDVAVEVTGGSIGEVRTLTVAVTDTVTSMSGAQFVELQPEVGLTDMLCFHARSDAGEIIGIPWAFSVEGTASLSSAFFTNCTSVKYLAPGRLVVIGSVPGGSSAQVVLEVAPGNTRLAPPAAKRLHALGERAATVDAQ